jgi:hypothetical protein
MYSIKYKLDIQAKKRGFTKQELIADNAGGTDALVVISIIRHGEEAHEGSKSFALVSRDGFLAGDPNEVDLSIPNTELFQVMSFIAKKIADAPAFAGDEAGKRKAVPGWQRAVANQVLERTRAALGVVPTGDT